jgi:cytochrome P450
MGGTQTVTGARRNIAPGPRGGFPLGSLPQFRRDPLGFLTEAACRHGDVARCRFGPVLAHLVNHPDLIEQVLQHNWRNYDKQTRSVAKIRATCGDSLLSSDGEAWLRQRRLIQPAFAPAALARHVPVMAAATAELLERWQAAARAAQAVNVVSEMARLTLLIAGQVLLGSDVRNDVETVEHSLATILDDTWRRIESIVDPAVVSPVFHRAAYREAVAALDGIIGRLIGERRRNGAAGGDLLSALVRAHDARDGALSDGELRDATLTLLLAGHETTANALAWSLWLIANDGEVAARLRQESRDVLGARLPESRDLDRLLFAAAAFSEAIRLYPSIWIMERRVKADDVIAGYRIPAGSTLLISPYVLHRTAEFWPEPDRFDPGRFARDHDGDRHPHTFIPFGLGPHHCIGRHLAQMVAQTVLTMVAGRFQLRCMADTRPVPLPGVTLRHAQPLWMVPETVE